MLTSDQMTKIQLALSMSAAIVRHDVFRAIDSGNDFGASLLACELVRIERANHIAWYGNENFEE